MRQNQWIIAGLCGIVILLAVIILLVQVGFERHLRAHTRALRAQERKAAEEGWREWPTHKF